MEKFATALRAAIVAAPLALSQVPASAGTDRVVETTKSSVSGIQISERESESLREGVRRHLLMEKCYVLTHPAKNASSWLAAIGTLSELNDRKADYETVADEFEKAKTRLESERKKAGASFFHITNGNRGYSETELKCLFEKKTRM